MRSESPDRPMKLIVLASLAVLIVALGALGALSAVGVVAESQPADAGPDFAVNVTDYDASVTEGDALVVEATVTNVGAEADSQQIHLKNGRNEILDSVADPPVTLAPNESTDVTLTWRTGPGDAETERVKVVSNHGTDDATVRIEEGSFLAVAGVETDSPVAAGDELTATVTVTNDDDADATRDVWIAVDGERVAETAVTLAPGETRTETLTWTDTAGAAGDRTLTAGTTGDRMTTEITLTEPETSGSTDGSEDAADDDDGGSVWSVPTYVEKRDNGVVDGDGVATLAGNEVAAVRFERETVSGRLIVDRLRGLPEGVTAPDEPVGMYRLDPDGEFADENATITFRYSNETVPRSAIDRVEVRRWNGTAWTRLDAEATSAGDQVIVDAETRGFSLFAVTTAGEPNATAAGGTAGNASATGETTANASAASNTNATADSPDTDSAGADAESSESESANSSATNETETATSAESANESPDDSTTSASEASEDESPGFGVVAALLALAVAAGVATRGRRRK